MSLKDLSPAESTWFACRWAAIGDLETALLTLVTIGIMAEISEDPQQAAREVALARSRRSRRSRDRRTRRS
jgi:hypothetical protein